MPTLIDQAPDQEELEEDSGFSEDDSSDTAANINKNLGYDDLDEANKGSEDTSDSDYEDEPEHHNDDSDYGSQNESESGSGGQKENESKQDDSGGGNRLDQARDLKDKFDKVKGLKDKLSGANKAAEAGKSAATVGEGVAAPAAAAPAAAVPAAGGGAVAGGGAAAAGGTVAAGGAAATSPAWVPFAIGAAIVIAIVILIILFIVGILHVTGNLGASGAEAAPKPGSGTGPGGGSIVVGSPRGCPMSGTITTPYGRNIITYSYYPDHYAVDIGDGPGTNSPVYNTLDGTAVSSTGSGIIPDQIVTVTAGEFSVVFHHLKEGTLITDGPVSVGDVIGNEDTTGNVDGEHLHYVVYRNGILQNPIDYMPATIYFTQPADNDFTGVPLPSEGKWGDCGTLPQDTIPGTGSGGGGAVGLNYFISYGDTSIQVADPTRIRDLAALSWPTNHINDPCPGGITCWDYVIQESSARGISPAFAITIWYEEGGFGGAGAVTEFGCYPPGYSGGQVSFLDSFNCFLNFTASEHPYNSGDPYQSFYDWVNNFCGPNREYICGPALDDPTDDNLNFIPNLRSVYESVSGITVEPAPTIP